MPAAKKSYSERYYTLSEDEMQDLITRAKEGDSKAQMVLLDVFANFLTKYTSLIYHSKFSLNDYDIRRFLALYVKDPIARRQLISNKMNSSSRAYVFEAVNGIHTMVVRYCSEEDVTQTVSMAFLQCVQRYERKGPIPFSGFLYSYFFYLLKKHVDEFMIDQLGRKTYPLLGDDDNTGEDDEEFKPGYHAPSVPGVEDMLGADVIDEFWVAGDTAMPPFNVLTPQERQLVRWRYVEGLKSSEIAYRITEHPNTCRESLNRIRRKLAEQVAIDLGESSS